jgi:hypothetical protein
LHNFSAQELDQNSGIESITMGDLLWTYVDAKDFDVLFIAADEKETNPSVLRSRLEVIKMTFFDEFSLTPEKWKELFHGDVGIFDKFKNSCDLFTSQWQEAEKISSTAEMFDLLGVCQQLFNLMMNIIKLNFFGSNLKEVNAKIVESYTTTFQDEEFGKNEELKTIKYDTKTGWNIINVNPANVSPQTLQKVLLLLLQKMKDVISEKLGKMIALDTYSNEIFPFIIGNWALIKKLGIERKILTTFLLK